MIRHHRFGMATYLAVFVCLCDQLSKWWAIGQVMQFDPHSITINPYLNFVLVWNKGITFGLLNQFEPHLMPYILIGIAILILGLLGRWLLRTTSSLVSLALGAIIGGAFGNVIDRFRYGAVADFLDFHYHDYHWYAFNIADAAIVVGVCFLLLDSLVRGR